MVAEAWGRIRAVFEAALELPEAERADYLERTCGGDRALQARVEELLGADSRGEGVLEPPPGWGMQRAAEGLGPSLLAGRRVGSYVIVRPIASGGMGTVYEAEQQSPRRTVALKMMRLGLGSADALRRFQLEGEVLARLRHPYIAQVIETGTFEEPGGEALPFFAMEYVEGGRDLAEYADGEGLGLRERLALFLKVCEAVQHGHEKGVVHRDLKPANVLVDLSLIHISEPTRPY